MLYRDFLFRHATAVVGIQTLVLLRPEDVISVAFLPGKAGVRSAAAHSLVLVRLGDDDLGAPSAAASAAADLSRRASAVSAALDLHAESGSQDEPLDFGFKRGRP